MRKRVKSFPSEFALPELVRCVPLVHTPRTAAHDNWSNWLILAPLSNKRHQSHRYAISNDGNVLERITWFQTICDNFTTCIWVKRNEQVCNAIPPQLAHLHGLWRAYATAPPITWLSAQMTSKWMMSKLKFQKVFHESMKLKNMQLCNYCLKLLEGFRMSTMNFQQQTWILPYESRYVYN